MKLLWQLSSITSYHGAKLTHLYIYLRTQPAEQLEVNQPLGDHELCCGFVLLYTVCWAECVEVIKPLLEYLPYLGRPLEGPG